MIRVSIEKRIKTYEGIRTLKVRHEFPIRSITPIMGPSGSGKTSFLKIIAGLLPVDKGFIEFENEIWLNTEKKILKPTQKRKLGMVFQNYALFPNMTVLDHMNYATKDLIWIQELLDLVKLDTFISHKPEHLSGGQQQRLSLIRALATRPQLLLMDEPFSALDQEMKRDLIPKLAAKFIELGTTVFMISHNLDEMNLAHENPLFIR